MAFEILKVRVKETTPNCLWIRVWFRVDEEALAWYGSMLEDDSVLVYESPEARLTHMETFNGWSERLEQKLNGDDSVQIFTPESDASYATTFKRMYTEGSGAITHIKRCGNLYRFSSWVDKTPATQAVVIEIEQMKAGHVHCSTTPECGLAHYLKFLDSMWN